jgi:hypothetical protein
MRFIFQRAQDFKPRQVVKVNFALRLAPPPSSFGRGPGIEKQTVGVVAEFRDAMAVQSQDLRHVLLLGKVPIDAVILDHGGQPMALGLELVLIELHTCLVFALGLLSLRLARGGLRHG